MHFVLMTALLNNRRLFILRGHMRTYIPLKLTLGNEVTYQIICLPIIRGFHSLKKINFFQQLLKVTLHRAAATFQPFDKIMILHDTSASFYEWSYAMCMSKSSVIHDFTFKS